MASLFWNGGCNASGQAAMTLPNEEKNTNG
jgi:hypothetical protein